MGKSNNLKSKRIWLSVLVLFVCVAASAVVLFCQMASFLPSDSGAIPLIPENALSGPGETAAGSAVKNTDNSQSDREESVGKPAGEQTGLTDETAAPGFEAADASTVWTTDTRVEIFSISYVNGEQQVTVNSDNGDKLIAPGTENSYTFKLKNTGNVALHYTVDVDAYFTPGSIAIPVTGRISRYDGQWIAGDKDSYADVSELDHAEDNATLGAGRYVYYTLDWLWPYESGNDGLDTFLGNRAVEEDLTFTVVIRTTAEESHDPSVDWGVKAPQTGDSMALWITLTAVSFVSLVFLAILVRRKTKLCDSEGGEH